MTVRFFQNNFQTFTRSLCRLNRYYSFQFTRRYIGFQTPVPTGKTRGTKFHSTIENIGRSTPSDKIEILRSQPLPNGFQ